MTKNSVRGALVWSLAERYLSLIISIIGTIILARLLTPKQVGIYSLCAVVATLSTIIRDFGVSEYLIQERNLTREKIRAAFTVTLAIAWLIAAIVFASRNLFSTYYNEPALAEVLSVLCINFLFLPLASPAWALLNRDMAFRPIFILQVSSNIASTAVSVCLAYLGYSYMSLAWGQVAGIITQVILLIGIRPRDSILLPGINGIRHILIFGSMFTASRITEFCARSGHELIIGKQFGFSSLGLFSRATGLIDLFANSITTAVLRVATPAMASKYRSGDSLAVPFANGTAIFTGLAWPFMAFVALMSHDIIILLFGKQWAAAAPIASILACAAFPHFLTALAPNALIASGELKRRLSVAMWYAPVHLTSVLIASFFGLQLVAYVFIIGNLLASVLYARHLRNVLNVGFKNLFGPTVASLKLTFFCVFSQLLALGLSQQLELPSIVRLCFVASATILSWLAAAHWLRHPVFAELQRVFKHIQAKKTVTE